jgi:hypothetical protein
MASHYTIEKITLTCQYCGRKFFRQRRQLCKNPLTGERYYKRIWLTRDQVRYCCDSHRVMAYQKRKAFRIFGKE